MQTHPPVTVPPPPAPTTGPPLPSQPPVQPPAAPTLALRLSTGKLIPAFRERKLLTKDIPELYPSTGDEAVAVIRQSPMDPTILGLMNCSRTNWTAIMPDGSQRQVESGKAVRLAEGTRIVFGQTQATVEVGNQSSAFLAQHGKMAGIGLASLVVLIALMIALFHGGKQDIAALVARCDKSMISVATNDGTGSAFFISSDGKALTNAHVVGNNDMVTVEFHDGKQLQAKVLAKDVKFDVALIQVQGGGSYDALDIDYSEQPKGTSVMALGFPKASLVGSLDNSSVAHGLVSRYLDRQKVDDSPGVFLQTDVSINHGNSGGPLINEDTGKVVGINSAVINLDQNKEPVQGMGFAIPMFEVRDKFLNKINQ